jgi:hypothetical protein
VSISLFSSPEDKGLDYFRSSWVQIKAKDVLFLDMQCDFIEIERQALFWSKIG